MKVVTSLFCTEQGFKQLDQGFRQLEGYEFAVHILASLSTFSK